MKEEEIAEHVNKTGIFVSDNIRKLISKHGDIVSVHNYGNVCLEYIFTDQTKYILHFAINSKMDKS